MASTFSKFTFGFQVIAAGASGANSKIDFNRGGVKAATVAAGDYTADEMCAVIVTALEAADSTPVWACSFDVSTGKFTISADQAFTLLWGTGANAAADMHKLLGFDAADQASSSDACVSDTAVPTAVASSGYPSTWTLAYPDEMHTPVTAAASGAAMTGGQRQIRAVQNVADGGLVNTIYHSTSKRVEIAFYTGMSAAEWARMENFLDWIERGRRFMWQPDSTATEYVKLVLADPSQITPQFEFLTRSEVSYGRLTFIEQVSRT